MAMLLDLDLKGHGDRQLELIASYSLEEDVKKSSLELDIFFFIPRQLRINKKSWPAGEFFRSRTLYSRYKTPAIPLKQLLRKNSEVSPLSRLKEIVKQSGNLRNIDHAPIVFELRTLLNVMEHHNVCLKKQLNRPELIDGILLLEEMEAVQAELDSLADFFLHPDTGRELNRAFELCREGISLQIEKAAGRLYQNLGKKGAVPSKNQLTKCALAVDSQQKYRKKFRPEKKTPLMTSEEDLFRAHELKKWGQQSLYLSSESSHIISNLLQFLFGIAAAVAMAFAVFTSLLTLRYFENGSPVWILVVVIAYSMKDRIKEGLRSFFIRFIPELYADRLRNLVHPDTKRKGGRFKERFRYLSADKLNRDVRQLYQSMKCFLNSDRKNHAFILQYSKKTILNNHELLDLDKERNAVADILRMDIQRWFRKMDKGEEVSYRLSGKVLQHQQVLRTYKIPIIISMGWVNEPIPRVRCYMLILNASGIVRIENYTKTFLKDR